MENTDAGFRSSLLDVEVQLRNRSYDLAWLGVRVSVFLRTGRDCWRVGSAKLTPYLADHIVDIHSGPEMRTRRLLESGKSHENVR